jgi:hypothetical protein
VQHDNYCPANGKPEWTDVAQCGPCQSIAAVRSDERARCIELVEKRQICGEDGYPYDREWNTALEAVLDHLRAKDK